MDPAVQVDFRSTRALSLLRTDVDKSKFDACTQKGMAFLADSKIVPEHAITTTPEQVGALTDFIGEFWASPSPGYRPASAAQFAAIFE